MPVNGIELKEGQIWKTKNYGIVTLSDSGVNANYPWRMTSPNNGDPISSITTDGKYWEEDEMPELLECLYNPEDKGEKKPMKFNPKSEPTKLFLPKPGDKIICNNGEEFICCTLEFLRETIYEGIKSDKPILGYRKFGYDEEWMGWDEETRSCPEEYGIREVIPQNSEVTDDKKEEVKEEPRYKAATAEQPLYTLQDIKEAWDASGWVISTSAWEAFQKNLTKINSPEYQEYLRLKAIYE